MKSPKFANAIVALMVPGCILLFSCDRFTPVGRIFAVDSSSVYGFGCQPRYYSQTSPLEHQLFGVDKSECINDVEITEGRRRDWLGPEREMSYRWADTLPLLVRAMTHGEVVCLE